MRYTVTHRTWYAYSETAPVCHNLAHLAPRTTERQSALRYELAIEPAPTITQQRVDYFGNLVDYFSIEQSHNGLEVTASSEVDVQPTPERNLAASIPWEEAARLALGPADDLTICQLTLPSTRVTPTAELRRYAAESFTRGRPVLEAIDDLQKRIYADFAFDSRATTIHTPLSEVLKNRRGVCQDFAHLSVGCLRSLGLACRYVSGYLRTLPPPGKPRLVGADASHAWASAWCGPDGWVDFDPTNNQFTSDFHISVAWGRDYGDVSPIQGVFVGGGEHGMGVSVDVAPLDRADAADGVDPVEAVDPG